MTEPNKTYESVSMGDITFDNINVGSVKEIENYNADSSHLGGKYVNYVDGVSTTSTAIMDFADQELGALVLVYGRAGVGTQFTDLVLYTSFGNHTVIANTSEGSPDGRTYSVSNRSLELAMASGTYDIATCAFAMANVA